MASVCWRWKSDRSHSRQSRCERFQPYSHGVASQLERQFQISLSDDPRRPCQNGMINLENGKQYKIDFNALRQYVTGNPGCRRAIDRQYLLPITHALLQPKAIDLHLAPNETIRARTGAVIDQIVHALQQGLRPQQIYEGGSWKKNTALGYDYDVDLVCFIPNFNHRCLPEYRDRVMQILNAAFPPVNGVSQVWYEGRKWRHVGLHFRMVNMDVLLTGDPSDNRFGNPEEFYEPAHSKKNDDAIVRAKGQQPLLHHLVLVAKHWCKRPWEPPTLGAEETNYCGRPGPRSCYLELLCKHVLEQRPCGSVAEAFKSLLQLVSTGRTAVPKWTVEQGEMDVQFYCRDAFIGHARTTLAGLE